MENNEINNLASRHIAKLLNRLAERHELPLDVTNAIKVQFRYFQDDIINSISDVKNDDRYNK